jgi:hypothetical protein
MVRERPRLGTPLGVDGPWLKAILDVLGDLHDLLEERLPKPAGGGEPLPASEPAPQDKPGKAVPVQEPAPVEAPTKDDDGDDGEPVEVTELAPSDLEPLPQPPPRAGRGSSETAWRAYAELVGVSVPDGAGRDDIIAACEQAGVIEPKEQ